MINLRYHIISITAVFLALGIGLTLGSTFLDRVTVDTLKNQLDTVQERVDETQRDNGQLRDRVASLEKRDVDLARQLPERLLEGHLTDVPVLIVAAEGTDEALVATTTDALTAAGAEVAGTWWMTDRWLLDDPEELDQLSTVLDLRTDDVDRLRRNGAIRLAELLDRAAEPASAEDVAGGVRPTDDAAATSTTTVPDGAAADTAPTTTVATAGEAAATEPELAAQLEEAGFLHYGLVPGADQDRVLLPATGTRYVVISDALPDSGPQLMADALIEELSADGGAPVVAVQGLVDLPDVDGTPASEEARRTSFVGPLRDGELTQDRISTVDSVDTAPGLAATILALEDLGAGRWGHYGVAPGASRLLPGTDPGP